MDLALKQAIHAYCQATVEARLAALGETLRDLSESVANETKSTAGDKYETARAMLHIEQDGVRRQQAEASAQLAVLHAINPALVTGRVVPGSLVRLDGVLHYLSIGLGRAVVDGQPVVVLSLQSPLGARLKGLTALNAVTLNGTTRRIDALL